MKWDFRTTVVQGGGVIFHFFCCQKRLQIITVGGKKENMTINRREGLAILIPFIRKIIMETCRLKTGQ